MAALVPVPSVEGQVSAAYSQIELHPGEGGAVHAAFDVGLARAEEPECAILTTACEWGRVKVTMTMHDERPAVDPAWDAAVELSMLAGDGAEVTGWASEGDPLVIPAASGTELRVRYVVISGQAESDRWQGEGDGGGVSLESYLLQLWSEPPTPATVVVSTTPWSRYWTDGAPGAVDGWETPPEQEVRDQDGNPAPAVLGPSQEDPTAGDRPRETW